MPLVSVCIPAYNCEKYVGDAVRSVLSQNYNNIEVIIVDDGSTDGTLNAIRKIDDSRVKTITSRNKGASAARNLAYQNSNGRYVIFFDADDLLPADFIAKQVNRANRQQDVVVLSGWGRFYNDDPGTFKQEEIPYREMLLADWINTYWYQGNPMTAPGRALIPRQLLENAGLWNEELTLNDDLEFYTRLFIKARCILFCTDALLYYRSGIGGLSGHKGDKAYRSLLKSIRLSVNHILQALGNHDQIKQSCANMLQGFIYELYPRHRKLVQEAQNEIDTLAKPNLKFMAGGLTAYLVAAIGWKFTKWVKLFLKVIPINRQIIKPH
ncbi:glycosyltransferase involved in cell wall biosynthesis [Mucilaginibacter oryzae]|uniref:Glycosyltransferase involved in cell wall biosynthesis n=2 Tax=Mucilaginibacter oryzae TaxID=468058 RepID=A0A316HF81_9SPHI|nr:glycosyltransferase involved in cell wall biosynthesis [Mucilaginibacter oryzae]